MALAPSPSRLSSRHLAVLDGVRGIAILIVMMHHFEFLIPGSSAMVAPIKAVLYTGWSGVDLFFVLSGFLITGILIDTHEATNYFSSFYARRILRIFPLYYCVLTVIVIAAHLVHRKTFDHVMALPSDQIFYFFYLNNWSILMKDRWHSNIIGHFWSLAVEEQFYLMWPMCVWLISKRQLLKWAVAGCLFAFVLRFALAIAYGPSAELTQNTFTRMDTLLAGACCAIIVRSETLTAAVKPWLSFAMFLAVGGMFWIAIFAGEMRVAGFYMETFGFSLLALGYSALLLRLFFGRGHDSRTQRFFGAAPLRAVGKYSYGMYVLHVPILIVLYTLCRERLGLGVNLWTSIAFFLAIIGISFLGAMASFELFEKRFLRMKTRFDPCFVTPSLTAEKSVAVVP